jgi:hypothetical protein
MFVGLVQAGEQFRRLDLSHAVATVQDIADRRKSPAGELLGSIVLDAAGVAARPTLLDR